MISIMLISECPSQTVFIFFLVTPNFVGNPSEQLAYEAKLSLVTKLKKLR